MKRSILLFLVLFNLSAQAGVRIVSDFDDTIKRSHIPEAWYSVLYNSVKSKKAYRGMPTLYKAMEKNSEGLYVLSASPNIVRSPIKKTLNYYSIPYAELFTRDITELCDKESYKIEKIESVIKDNNDSLILLGDNVEADHIVYMEVAKNNPGRVSDIYIRKVLNTKLPKGINGFFTAFDIAVKEYDKGRLSFNDIEDVANIIISTKLKNMYQLIPRYAYCPMDKDNFPPVLSGNADIKQFKILISNKIIKYCKKRASDRLKHAQISKEFSELRKMKNFISSRDYRKLKRKIRAKRSRLIEGKTDQFEEAELEE